MHTHAPEMPPQQLSYVYVTTLRLPSSGTKKLVKAYTSRISANAAARVLLRRSMEDEWRVDEEYMDEEKLYHGFARSADADEEWVKVKVKRVEVVEDEEDEA